MRFDPISNAVRFYEQMTTEQRDAFRKKDDTDNAAQILLARVCVFNDMEMTQFNEAIEQIDRLTTVWHEREAAALWHKLGK
jgi:hypothetical protein